MRPASVIHIIDPCFLNAIPDIRRYARVSVRQTQKTSDYHCSLQILVIRPRELAFPSTVIFEQ